MLHFKNTSMYSISAEFGISFSLIKKKKKKIVASFQKIPVIMILIPLSTPLLDGVLIHGG